jgi:MoxR-like ATPase
VLESVSPIADDQVIERAREEIRSVTVSGDLMQYIAQIVSATRKRTDVEAGVSPRGTLALLHASRSLAFLEGRDFVAPEDIKRLALPVLAHRLVLTRRYGAGSGQRSVMEEILSRVPVPTENFAGDKK